MNLFSSSCTLTGALQCKIFFLCISQQSIHTMFVLGLGALLRMNSSVILHLYFCSIVLGLASTLR